MKMQVLVPLMALSLLSSLAYSNVLGPGMLVADPVFVFFAWICLVDHWSRVAVVGGGFILYRIWGTVATPIEVALPFLIIFFLIRVIRGGVSPYHPWRRLLIVLPALVVAGWFSRNLLDLDLHRGPSGVFIDLLIAFIVSAALFPLLDLTRPLLRSARFPQ